MIPKFNQTMLPILKVISDWKMYTLSQVSEVLELEFQLTKEEKEMKIWNGSSLFRNKVGWWKSYLRQAWLTEIPKR